MRTIQADEGNAGIKAIEGKMQQDNETTVTQIMKILEER
jgi:hypothetical protein